MNSEHLNLCLLNLMSYFCSDYPPPSLTPPGPPPNVRTSSHAHTPPGHYPHSATPPPPPDDYKHPRHNSYTPPHRAYTPPHAAGRSFTPPSPPPPPVSAVGTRRSYSPPSPKHTDLTSRISSFFHHSQSQVNNPFLKVTGWLFGWVCWFVEGSS